jgi:hypothetical protein
MFLYWLISGIITMEFFRLHKKGDNWFLAVCFAGGGIILPTLIITEYFWQLIKWMLCNTKKGNNIRKELEEFEKEIKEEMAKEARTSDDETS